MQRPTGLATAPVSPVLHHLPLNRICIEMSSVLIIGAGGVGRVVTHKCAQIPEVFSEICLASRTRSKCDQIAGEIEEKSGRKIATAQ
ncbi:MAG: saccharopine dehydrogenase NADP-binding domain-containing protein, partial [Sedimenticola sp.]